MLTKDILQKLIGILIVYKIQNFIILNADDLIQIYDVNSKNKTNLTIKKFERLLPNLFVYASDETDDLTPLIEFIKDI